MVYISGPMSGHPQLNYDAFQDATRKLRVMGLYVISPHEINPNDGSVSYQDCLRRDLAALLLCDSIYMLEGWVTSKGACLEKHIADCLNMQIQFQPKGRK